MASTVGLLVSLAATMTCTGAEFSIRMPTFVYSGSAFNITCTAANVSPSAISVRNTLDFSQPPLQCDVTLEDASQLLPRPPFSASGSVTVSGCRAAQSSAGGSVTFIIGSASSAMAGTYLCYTTYAYISGGTIVTGSYNTTPAALSVYVSPGIPSLSLLTFNDGDAAVINCATSAVGIPAAVLQMTYTRSNLMLGGADGLGLTGSSSSALNFTASPNWDKAVVTCNVTNHDLPGLYVTSNLTVNYIRARNTSVVLSVDRTLLQLQCSQYVSSNVEPTYVWLTGNVSVATADVLTPACPGGPLPSQVYVCIATRGDIGKSINVSISVTWVSECNQTVPSPTPARSVDQSCSERPECIVPAIVIPVALLIGGVVAAVVFRKKYPHLFVWNNCIQKKPSLESYGAPAERTDNVENADMVPNDLYASIPMANKPASRADYGADGEPQVGASDLYASVAVKRTAVVIASDVMSNRLSLRSRVAPHVFFVQYTYAKSTLTKILDKVAEDVQKGSHIANIAFVLQSDEERLLLSDEDTRVICKDSVKSDGYLRRFFTNLFRKFVPISGEVTRERRLDILNCAQAATPGGKTMIAELEHLLELRVSLSKDMYGRESFIDSDKRVPISTLYFRQGFQEINYAHIDVSAISQSKVAAKDKRDEAVVYAEVKRKADK